MLINLIRYTKYESDLLLNTSLKPDFEYKITLWICVLVLGIYKGYCIVKSLCEIFVYKKYKSKFQNLHGLNLIILVINIYSSFQNKSVYNCLFVRMRERGIFRTERLETDKIKGNKLSLPFHLSYSTSIDTLNSFYLIPLFFMTQRNICSFKEIWDKLQV